jgi:hypothetical protein
MRLILAAAAAALLTGSPAIAGDPIAAVNPGHSATKARDIQGFALGAPIKEAMERFTPTFAQGDQVQGTMGDIELTFGTCPSGAVYFIESSQPLGDFTVDKTFLDALQTKLFAKYGRGYGSADNLSWDLTDPVRYTTGEVLPFTSNCMTALVMHDSGDGVSLQLKMLDFRICWAEREKANQRPRSAATDAVKL